MNIPDTTVNLGIACGLFASAGSHAYLYLHGYQHIPMIGPGFLVLVATFGALGVLIAVGGPAWLHLAALVGSAGAVAAFALSRTTGLFGFGERGLQPAPHALLSLLAELVVVALTMWSLRGIFGVSRPVRTRAAEIR
ncbi:hypothetical protein [Mycolicibacterium mageritense]|uniref:DUF4345 domain-containing protein n=1 Tax=Mycolicibacterium mageritense TaxID=53462 RepID=A0ABN5YDA4_MYCME|nr:hypothetical protein [Mycolicibacterium mageritense]MBN3452890.1 hypothetical protein [Mycobacterium sp. DSM 3803]OKH70928.1 hypothetical protein EB73_11170 [Mycobacterium sp. SWH-M3]MCC9184675.1 hypothetical protein [Mycolicibacterium mageritense]CDO20120.1 hypothetical protein BN978_00572 [Mycolicibacterium mageritense DSM 44476 = CIP 104973]BBX35371.1 hypothetical protein MMAGJ_46530 [Mycolicibacterium mageritense]